MAKSRRKKKRLSYAQRVDRVTAVGGFTLMIGFGLYMVLPLFIK